MTQARSLDLLKSTPEKFVDLPAQALFSIPGDTLHDIQLSVAKRRFSELSSKIPMLNRLVEEQGIKEIGCLEDLAPLLVPHSAYKSYPLSVLETGRFDKLTRWFDGFTTEDLSTIDASKCDSIDEWIDLIDAKSNIRLVHSSGTSGKLSFLPRTEQESAAVNLPYQLRFFDSFNDDIGVGSEGYENMPIVYPSFRKGGMGQQRRMDVQVKYWHRNKGTPVVTLFPGRLSADALSLGGRLSAAEARGELGRLAISPALLKRRDELLKEQAAAPQRYEQFLDNLEAIRGRRVYITGHPAQFFDAAVAAKKRGLRNVFAPDSLVVMGGGTKGRALPDNWEEVLKDFLGCDFRHIYGMSETMAGGMACKHGHFHYMPWVVLYLLDPKTGAPLPRTGTQTGRLGVFDITAWTYWGGFLTGDEITISWADKEGCPCGRTGPFLHPTVRRYTEKEGGDDKITCAGVPDAHDKALDFILQQVG